MSKEKVVLAYSGGLDTSVCVKWLQDEKNLDVVCVCGNVGQEETGLDAKKQKALDLGVLDCQVLDLRDEFSDEFLTKAIAANSMYENKYPLLSALSRPLLAKKLVEVAHEFGATYVAHGCTGKGNDQVRFEAAVKALDPELKVIAPVREWDLKCRPDEVAYAHAHNVPVPEGANDNPYSIDDNLWGRAIECGVLEDTWNKPPADIWTMTKNLDECPADPEEVKEAMEEGVQFRFLSAPAEILGENGKVKALKVEIMELGEPDEKGRRKPVGTGKFETIEVTSVIGAIGQTVDWGTLDTGALTTTKKGTAEADALTYQTAQPDIFVGGDVCTGPRFAIDAIAAGKQGAISIHRFVQPNTSLTIGRNRRDFHELDKSNLALGEYDRAPRQSAALDAGIDAHRSFRDAHLTLTEDQVKIETARCLGCGASVVDPNKCIGCGVCTTKCEFDAIRLHRDLPECSKMVKSEDKFKAILPYMAKREIKIRFAKKEK